MLEAVKMAGASEFKAELSWLVKDSKILYELKERQYYVKPSIIKKEKRAKAKARMKKQSKFD